MTTQELLNDFHKRTHSFAGQHWWRVYTNRRYLFSLPERSTRSLAAIVGGMSFLLTDTLLPLAFRESTFYRAFVGNIQRFVAARVGDVPIEDNNLLSLSGAEIGDDFVQRKMLGNTLEVAGILATRVSPIWVFALASDAVAGGAVFVERLADNLRRNNVIPEDAKPDNLTELFEAMEQALRTTAAPIDTPPLSSADIAQMTDELRDSYGNLLEKSTQMLPEFETIWQRMIQVSQSENISIEQLSGIMTIDALQNGLVAASQTSLDVTQAVGTTSTELFDEKILESYRQTLNKIVDQGAATYIGATLQPFLTTAASHFDPSRSTWTERWLGTARTY